MYFNGVEIIVSNSIPDGKSVFFEDKILMSEKTYKALTGETNKKSNKKSRTWKNIREYFLKRGWRH